MYTKSHECMEEALEGVRALERLEEALAAGSLGS